MDKLLIKNVHIIDPSQSLNCISDIMIEDGVISKLGKNLTVDCKTIDGSGLYAAPGLVDMHVHPVSYTHLDVYKRQILHNR